MAGTDVVQLGQQLGLALSSAGDLRYCISWSIVGVPQRSRKSVSSVWRLSAGLSSGDSACANFDETSDYVNTLPSRASSRMSRVKAS